MNGWMDAGGISVALQQQEEVAAVASWIDFVP